MNCRPGVRAGVPAIASSCANAGGEGQDTLADARPRPSPRGSVALVDEGIELPRINYGRCNERPYRYVWGNGFRPEGWIDRILKIDTTRRRDALLVATGCYLGEPVFVASPEAEHEDDGVLLSVVLDATRAGPSCSCSTPPI